MTVNSTTIVQGAGQGTWRSTVKQAGQDFNDLLQAMQAGNLAGAQQAYGALQQLQGSDANGAAADATPPAHGTSSPLATLSSDWSSLGQALQAGDMTSAQGAFSQLQTDLQAGAAARHRHHHHGSVDKAQDVYAAMQSASGSQGTGTANAVGNDIDGLKQALQSGNVSSAQDLLARLEQDLRTSAQYGRHPQGDALPQGAATGSGTPAATAATAAA